jgi:putative aldouronate transport system substrate-binding protein
MLDEFGLEIPTTVAEMETAFAAYKAKYPDQYPTAGGGKDLLWQSFTEVFNSCGVDFFSWDLIDGKIVPGWTQPEAKEVLGILADWVQKGYISKAFVTMTDADKSNEWTSGKSLYRNWQGIQIIDPPYADGSQFSLIKEVAPDASFAFGPPPTLHEGVLPVNHGWDPFHGGSAGFGKHMQDDPEKLHRLMIFLDDTYGDPEVADYLSWGDEGTHWKWSDDNKTLRERLPGFSTADEVKSANLLIWAQVHPDYSPYYYMYAVNPNQTELKEELLGDGGMLSADKVRRNPNRVKGVLTSPEGEDLSQLYWSDLEKKRDIMVVEIISGEKPLSAYDEWIEYWNENGGAELEEAANRLYLDLWK